MDDNVSQGVNMTVRIFSVGALIIGIVEVKSFFFSFVARRITLVHNVDWSGSGNLRFSHKYSCGSMVGWSFRFDRCFARTGIREKVSEIFYSID
jgi:hypothetical protein